MRSCSLYRYAASLHLSRNISSRFDPVPCPSHTTQNVVRMSSTNKSNYFASIHRCAPNEIKEGSKLIMGLPSAATPKLAASRPREVCRRETGGICRCRVQARGCVPGSSLPAVFQVAARRPQTALDWHSSLLSHTSLLNFYQFSAFFREKTLFTTFFFFYFGSDSKARKSYTSEEATRSSIAHLLHNARFPNAFLIFLGFT